MVVSIVEDVLLLMLEWLEGSGDVGLAVAHSFGMARRRVDHLPVHSGDWVLERNAERSRGEERGGSYGKR